MLLEVQSKNAVGFVECSGLGTVDFAIRMPASADGAIVWRKNSVRAEGGSFAQDFDAFITCLRWRGSPAKLNLRAILYRLALILSDAPFLARGTRLVPLSPVSRDTALLAGDHRGSRPPRISEAVP
jgi:hypothetical protein